MSYEVLSLNQLGKVYKIYSKPQDRLLQMLFGRYKRYYQEFWALREVSFSVRKGECIGIIGRNGAGKSTLLQLIAQTLFPSEGSIKVVGRVAALLELGTGFNPEFTGKENVYLNAAILGLSQSEINERYEEIVHFADIGEFIHQPVKTYSSGMLVRLAFAVAINVDPDILIIDEALSVGDAKFQAKCFRKFQDFRERQKTILFVSHATEQVIRHCDQAILLEHGCILNRGEPKEIANEYLNLLFGIAPVQKQEAQSDESLEVKSKDPDLLGDVVKEVVVRANGNSTSPVQKFLQEALIEERAEQRAGYNKAEYRWGSGEAKIVDYLLANNSHWDINHFSATDTVTLYIKVRFYRDVARPIYALTIKTPDGITVYGTNSRDWDNKGLFVPRKQGDQVVVRFFLVPRLISGHYLLSLGVVEDGAQEVIPLDRRYDFIEVYITNVNKSFGIADLSMCFESVA